MTPRLDRHTATMIDLARMLLPIIGTQAAARLLARRRVALGTALRVLASTRSRGAF